MKLQEMEVRTPKLNLCMMNLIRDSDGMIFAEYKKQGRSEKMPIQYLLDKVDEFEKKTS